MKNYRITVNGNTYDVQVEELGKSASVTVPTAAPAPVSAPTTAAEGTNVTSPMPGNILDIKVNVGDKVAANQVVVILEAMKMENDIVTPAAGTVASINVTKGQAVNSGDVLITVAE